MLERSDITSNPVMMPPLVVEVDVHARSVRFTSDQFGIEKRVEAG